MIINPNATIALSARLPSDPEKAATITLPLDIHAQGIPPNVDLHYLTVLCWVLMHNVVSMQQRIDRLERLAVRMLDDLGRGEIEDVGLAAALTTEVRARRAAEAKAREEQAKSGGVQ